jgi:hypothetical protein
MSTRDSWQLVTVSGFDSTGIDMQIGVTEAGTLADEGDFIYIDDAVLDAGPVLFSAVLGAFVDNDPEKAYIWDDFDNIKAARFIPMGRLPIFHYAIAASRFGLITEGSSGISHGVGASDFIVSLGAFFEGHGTQDEQAGAFMHELGHNLGLRHGGATTLPNYKPNYLSVMNYSFNLLGIIKDGNLASSTTLMARLLHWMSWAWMKRSVLGLKQRDMGRLTIAQVSGGKMSLLPTVQLTGIATQQETHQSQ